jgi:5-bromo-4-chloroindolyl phosphate hydrolysis protein
MFKLFLEHDEEFIRDIALLLEQAKEKLEKKELSKKEYIEIIQDLTELDEARAKRLSFEKRAAIENTLRTMKSIAEKILSII